MAGMVGEHSRRLAGAGAAAVVLALAPVLTGCGSDDGSAGDVPTITTRPSTPATRTSNLEPSEPPTSTTTTVPESSETSGTSGTSGTPEPTTSAPSPTGSPTATTDAPRGPTTYAAALARIDDVAASSAAPVTAARFSTARDVVYCLLDDDVIGPACELRTGFIEDESYCGGAATNGIGRIETFQGRAQPVCNTDTIREGGARVVTAPGVVRTGGVECGVERFGVTCVDTGARTGFFIGPGEYHVF
jgi:hypothetical protein